MALSAPLLSRKKVIQVSAESTKGTTVAAATDILVFDPVMKPESIFTERKGSGKFLGHTSPGINDAPYAGTCTFTAELRGTDSTALDAGLAILLTGCGLKATGQAYTPTSLHATQKTITISLFEDGVKKRIYGAMGNCKFTGGPGARIMMEFEFTGCWAAPIDAALPTVAHSAIVPMRFNSASGAFTLAAQAIKLAEFAFDLGNEIVARPDVGAAGGLAYYMITDRDPTWEMDLEADKIAGYDFYGAWLAGAEVALSLAITNGTDVATFAAPKLQYRQHDPGDRDKIQIYNTTAQCNISVINTGDDEFSITIT